jgi:hypothetical protein
MKTKWIVKGYSRLDWSKRKRYSVLIQKHRSVKTVIDYITWNWPNLIAYNERQINKREYQQDKRKDIVKRDIE